MLGLISHSGAGMLQSIEWHLYGLQNKHILKATMGPPVRMLYPNMVIQFQQDHSSIHDSTVIKERLLVEASVQLCNWPLQAPGMNRINM
jgi:hypothetical protein